LQNLSRVAVEQQRALTSNNLWYAPDPTVLEGVSVPIWVDNKLLFVRRVNIGGSEVIQGCWFDWSALREWLLEPARERLPDVDLVAVADREPQSHRRMLASLPVALTVPLPHLIQTGSDPMAWALGAAWACLLIATIAVGALLQGVIRLSERRAQFVSAVTHELRTPLTTFRMYSEMLLQNMIEDPEKKRSYLQTLNEEADRLTHLVENVLSYARLERGSASMHLETLTASRLIEHSRARLEERAREANMDFECSLPTQADSIAIHTNVSAVEQILFNLVENACKYACHGSDPVIQMEAKIAAQQLEISIQDFGPGIPADEKRRLFRPFHKSSEEAARSAPGVGLGLALSRRLARDLGGNLRLDHHATSGARFCLSLPLAPSNEKTNFSGIIGE